MKTTSSSFRLFATVIMSTVGFLATAADTTDPRGLVRNASAPVSDKRIALVIGNTAYDGKARLKNPGNDAQDLAATLKKLDFKLVPANAPVLDANRETMLKAIREFETELKRNPGAVGLFYFSGHGTEIGGFNYLLPLGKDFDSPESVKDEAISAQNLLERMKNGNARASLVILDACRDNPWAKSWNPDSKGDAGGGGLASMQPPNGFLISFAAQPGRTASDNGQARNGLFTGMLLSEIQKPGLHIYDVFANVRKRVMDASNNKQLPEERNVMTGGALYLAGEPAGTVFDKLLERYIKGDQLALAELERMPKYQALVTHFKLNVPSRPSGQAATSVGTELTSDRQSVALSIAQTQSQDPDERALGEAMVSYLRFNRAGRDDLQSQANAGNRFASVMLERMYRQGVAGTTKDIEAANRLKAAAQDANAGLERLAAKNNVIALSWLANRYRNSDELAEQRKAVGYFEKAAAAGYPYAFLALGYLNDQGKGGLTKDAAKAMEWFRKGAEAGDRTAMCKLGWMYESGKGGLTKDEVKAVEWYRKGAEAGDIGAMVFFGWMYEHGKGGLAKDEVKAVEWYRKGAEAGNGGAMGHLARMYEGGKGGLTKDEVKAVEWFRKGAEAGDIGAMVFFGWMYEHGKGGLAKDEVKAVEWYRKGAEAGSGNAMTNLGVMYELGLGGLTKDEVKAVEWYRKAAALGGDYAKKRLTELGQ